MQQPIDRRDFLKSSAAAGAALAAAGASSQAQAAGGKVNQNTIPVCDTHLHLWDLEKFTLPWLSSEGVQSINHSFVMKDYLKATAKMNVAKAVYMEVNVASELQTKEAKYVLALCERDDNPMVGAVIGGSPQSAGFRAYVENLAGNPHLKGVRTVLHDADRPKGLCLTPQFVEYLFS